MVTVSHHTRACPWDISGLLISAFPGSQCVVTVTSQLGFLSGEEGRSAGERNRTPTFGGCCSQNPRSRCCLLPVSPVHQADLHPKDMGMEALAARKWFLLDHRPDLGSAPDNTALAGPITSNVLKQRHNQGLRITSYHFLQPLSNSFPPPGYFSAGSASCGSKANSLHPS